jgi:hypothetical protein
MSTPVKFFERYTVLVHESDLIGALGSQIDEVRTLLGTVTDARASQLDLPYTWTIKQVVQHIIDAERVFGYRALRFSRADATPLPGFDENAYASAIDVSGRSAADLVEEFESLRRSHVLLFKNLAPDAWAQKGTASGIEWSVMDLAKAVVGHARHHLQIVEKRLSS